MSVSVSDELQLFAQEIQSFLSPNTLRDLARDVSFVQRTSKYQAKDLVALCVWLSQNVAMTSLTQLSSCLEASTEVFISPEGLNQRFNQAAVQFLQHILAELLNQKLASSMPISSPYTSIFKRIRILDSTAFQLPDPFSFVYPGAGGCSHTAGVKIQLEYDLLSGQFLHIHTGPGKQHDRTYGSLCVPTVTANDLCIRDLGYFHLKDLQHIQDKKAQTKLPIQQIVEKMIGTKEQTFAEFHVSEGRYEYILEEMKVAQNLLTKEEFDKFVKLQTEEYIIDKKIRSVGTPEDLEADNQKKLEENSKAIEPLWGKIYSHFTSRSFDFPIKKPNYVAKGYELKREKVEPVITSKKLNPIISSEYRAGEFGYTIYQSDILERGRDPFYQWINDKIENYELEGAQFIFGKMTGSNVKGMKMIVPAKGKDSTYQVVIIDDVLNKAELEKVMISFLFQFE
ncbi:IS4 family transposase [Bacillus cereus]|nr:IS4 family transposase [Bacillus cereus]